MSDLQLIRNYPVSQERLFEVVTSRAELVQWWGPETMHVPEDALDFTRTGPWFSVIVSDEGQRYKVSGQVTHVDVPNSVGFTWGWHDDADQRGRESHVTFTVEATDTGARLILDHRDLDDSEQSENHARGWTSALTKLDKILI